MTDPVDTDALRAMAAAGDYNMGPFAVAAADEVDRLRVSDSNATQQRDQLANALRRSDNENDRLRALIKDAPHERSEEHPCYAGILRSAKCTRWKAGAL